MAGSPGGIARPARVTVPTPAPARNATPPPGSPRRTVARMRAPWVTSGSSPASLTTPAVAQSRFPAGDRQREAWPLAMGQRHFDRIGERAGEQRGIGGLGRRRGAGAGGPAAAKRRVLHGHLPSVAIPAANSDTSGLGALRPHGGTFPSLGGRGEGREEGAASHAQTRSKAPSTGAQERADLSPRAGRDTAFRTASCKSDSRHEGVSRVEARRRFGASGR